ncbi:MAG TPA: single-stranded-DNA-specific exonuclease RecJ [Pyrinomonadaceae bacterium]|jgi:single-stranded-DNA-specific exonuclease|nr:single-stranded-DNA-specific exonuclease RecJ [Pyrinomonadaceae bacterium]
MKAKRWIVRWQDAARAASLARVLGVSPILATLLISRGYDDESAARSFLTPCYKQIHEPYLMLGMREAVARLQQAIDRDERILIYGDYDVDGTTGTAVLLRALKLLGARTGFHVPHRFTEGYGIQQAALEKAFHDGYRLVVSVDCGIRAHEPLYWARDNGLDVVITDHHLPDDNEGAPPAFAVLNPNQAGCAYPDKNLAGVGVAFKLIHALFRERGRESQVAAFMKVVAIGTVADVAKLVGENRTIVALGLKDLAKASNPGLRALIEVAGCGDGKGMTAYDLGFRLGPRINAAGRMDAAKAVVELFDTRDADEARRLAIHLDTRNEERKLVQQQIIDLAVAELSGDKEPRSHVAVIAGVGWHRGVIGIAASKIAERINRPCVVFSIDGDIAHGSGRSIEAYHLLDGLTTCADLFEKFGGHSHAAGITIRPERIDQFRQRLNQHAASCLSDEDLEHSVTIDMELKANEVTFNLARELEKLEPYGAGNPRPVFWTRNLRCLSEPVVMKDRHLKMRVAGENNRPLEAVWWHCLESGRQTPEIKGSIELAYTIETSVWNDEIKVQLSVQDMRCG